MSSNIILTGANAYNTNNNDFVFKFSRTQNLQNFECCLQSLSIYYSWFNISSTAYNNNTFSYQWYDNTTAAYVTYYVTLPDGLYGINDINAYMQSIFIQNGHYSIDTATGNYVYYITMEVNTVLYSVQLNTFPVTTTPPDNIEYQFTAPTETFNPILQFLTGNFYSIVGYALGFATTESNAGTILSFSSSTSPEVQPSPTLFMSVSCVNNFLTNPPNILFAVTPNVDAGANYSVQPFPVWADVLSGNYSEIRVQFYNTNFQAIPIQDNNICIILLLRQKQKS